jgi:hypothetical protein
MEGRAGIRGHENWTIRNPKLNSPVFLSQASTSIVGSSSNKRSQTPQQQYSEGQKHHHQDYHPTPHFPVGPPMPRPWGPPPMMFPPCPPWAGWYGPWVPSLMHFHPGWSGPAQGFSHRGYYTGDGWYEHIGYQQGREALGRKTGQLKMPNWTIRFPRRQRQHLVASRGRGHPMSVLLISWEAVKRRWIRRINLRPMMK